MSLTDVYNSRGGEKAQIQILMEAIASGLSECIKYHNMSAHQIAEANVDLVELTRFSQGLKISFDGLFQQLNNPVTGIIPKLEISMGMLNAYIPEAIKRDRLRDEQLSTLLNIVTQLAAVVTQQNDGRDLKIARVSDFISPSSLSTVKNESSDYGFDGVEEYEKVLATPVGETVETKTEITRKKAS